jgi:hypothetical protein
MLGTAANWDPANTLGIAKMAATFKFAPLSEIAQALESGESLNYRCAQIAAGRFYLDVHYHIPRGAQDALARLEPVFNPCIRDDSGC